MTKRKTFCILQTVYINGGTKLLFSSSANHPYYPQFRAEIVWNLIHSEEAIREDDHKDKDNLSTAIYEYNLFLRGSSVQVSNQINNTVFIS